MSIIEIAEKAGVSISTVSRFFNRPETVSEKVAARIRAVSEQVNYQPKIVRPGPKGAARIGIKTGVIALVSLADYSPSHMWRLPALPVLIGSIQATLLRKQLSLFLGHLDSNGRLPECVSGKRCDGIIFFSKSENPEVVAKFKKFLPDLPAVWCFREHLDDEHKFDHVFYDNASVGVIAADYLAARGHRKVAVFNTSPTHTAFAERVRNFVRRNQEHSIETFVFEAKNSQKNGREAFGDLAREFIRSGAEVDGIFFCVDQDMLGIYIELLKAGFPADRLDMVGCNADEVALQYIVPRPATIDIKIAQIGQMAVDQLLRRINGDASCAANEIFIKPELIAGASRHETSN